MDTTDATLLTQQLHSSKNSTDFTTNVGYVNAFVSPQPWIVTKWEREIYLKNILFGTNLTYGS